MPELSPRQVAIWLSFAAIVLFVGGKALRGGADSTALDATAFAGVVGDRPEETEVDDPLARAARPNIWVHVAGAVRRPGIYRLPKGSRVANALRRAGGGRPAADLDRINLAATVSDGEQVLIPWRDQALSAAGSASPSGSTSSEGLRLGADAGATGAPISLASATAELLETIDGIGPVTAGKIVEFRDGQGGVNSIEELDSIAGIGPATMETLRQALVP